MGLSITLHRGQAKLVQDGGVHCAQGVQRADAGNGLCEQRPQRGQLELEVVAVERGLQHVAHGEIDLRVLPHVRVLLLAVHFVAPPEILVYVTSAALVVPVAKAVRAAVDAVDGSERGQIGPAHEFHDVGGLTEAVKPGLQPLHKDAEIQNGKRLGLIGKMAANDAFAQVKDQYAFPAVFSHLRRVKQDWMHEVLQCAEQCVAELLV